MATFLDFLARLFRRQDDPEPAAPPSVVVVKTPPARLVTFGAMRAAAPEATPGQIDRFVEPLDEACREWGIDTPIRVAAFLAQLAHETGGFRWTRELASGAAYEGRADLGNVYPGDGVLFSGRGLIQLTGRRNYTLASRALFGDDRLLLAPSLAERPDVAARVAAWYWRTNGLNDLADQGDFYRVTRRINGGTNGLPDRIARWNSVRLQMGIA